MGFNFFSLAYYGHLVSKVECKWAEEKTMFFVILNWKVTETQNNKQTKNYRPSLYRTRLEFIQEPG